MHHIPPFTDIKRFHTNSTLFEMPITEQVFCRFHRFGSYITVLNAFELTS